MYFKLKFEIGKHGYSIEKFASKIGIAEKSLRNKINGVTEFTWSECQLIRKILTTDLTLEELFVKDDIAEKN